MGISRTGMFPWAHKKNLSQIGQKISRPGPKTFAPKRVATRDFCGFWAPKGQIFTNMTPLLLFMINTIILHVIVKFGCARSKIVDFRLKKPYFSGFFAIISKSHFAQTKNTKVNWSQKSFDVFGCGLHQVPRKGRAPCVCFGFFQIRA